MNRARSPEFHEPLDGGARRRTPGQVAADDYRVDSGLVDLGQDRFERRKVSVDVVNRRDTHIDRVNCGAATIPPGLPAWEIPAIAGALKTSALRWRQGWEATRSPPTRRQMLKRL